MVIAFKQLARFIINLPSRWICSYEFNKQSFDRFNERPVEFDFLFKHLARIYPNNILDVGTGTTALPHLMRNCGFIVTAIDNIKEYWPKGMANRHYYVIDDDITKTQIEESFDFITCVSVLEHIERYDDAVRNMSKLLKANGHLVLTFPYNKERYIRNIYDSPEAGYGQDAPYICQVFSRNEIDKWVKEQNLTIIEQEYWQFWEGEYWTFGNQVIPPLKVNENQGHQLTCLLLQKID